MRSALVSVGLAALAGCASGSVNSDGGHELDARRTTDAAATDGPARDGAAIDAAASDARPIDGGALDAPNPIVVSLTLTELVLAPTGGELIELLNPTASAVDLGTYYLSDAPAYFKLPAGVAMVGADSSDFVARFPAGAVLAPGAVATVALDTAANFTTTYPGVAPTYSIASGTMIVLTAGTAPTLTNAGEPVILFQWNGASDKVTDVDIMVAGTPSTANALVAKTPVDGPDADSNATAYAADALTIPTQSAPAAGRSTKRLALESAATETQSGGNGVSGHDETSEHTDTTWDTAAYTAPTPGTVPAALQP